MKMNLTLCSLSILFLLNNSIAEAQESIIRLVDEASSARIPAASYQYGSINGVADFEGRIAIQFSSDDTLVLSHLNYGEWKLTAEQVKTAIEQGVIFRSPDFKNIHPVVVIAMHSGSVDERSISLNDQDKLSHDGGSILSQSPAISSIRKSGNYGFDPVLRGFKYDQLNIVIDGAQCALAACPNRMDPPTSQIAPNMISRVDIFKGPHTLRYGNSFGGTINFISSTTQFSEKKQGYGRISGGYESNGNVIRSEALAGVRANRVDLGIYGSWSQGSDYRDGEGETVSSRFKRGSMGARLAIKVASNQVLSLSATRNFARDVDFPSLPMDLRSDDTWLLNARHVISVKEGKLKQWQTNIFGTAVDHFMDNRMKTDPPMEAETSAKTYSYGGRTEGTWVFPRSKMYAGLDLRVEEAEGNRSRIMPNGNVMKDNAWQDARVSKTGFFGEYHYSIHSYKLVVSGRLELNESDLSDVSQEFSLVYPETDILEVNPGISFGGVYESSAGYSIGIWLGRTQRSAGITERYINYFPVGLDPYEMLGNPLLNQEVNNQSDLVFNFKNAKLSTELDFFCSYLQDYISSEIIDSLAPRLPKSPGVRQYLNIGDALLTGFEFSLSQILWYGLQHRLSFAYTYGKNLADNHPLPEIAPYDMLYKLKGNYFDKRLSPEISFRFVSEQNRIAESFGETASPSFFLLDVELQWQITANLRIAAAVMNIFDQAYYEHLARSVRGGPEAIYAPGRSIKVLLSYDLR